MATRTTSQAGDWSSSSTWGGDAAPGNGDTAVIGHAVTMDGNVTVGTSPAEGTDAVTINVDGGGALTLSATYQLTLRGDCTASSSTGSPTGAWLTMGAGSTIEFDSSQASSPSTTSYQIKWSGTSYKHIQVNGTSGSRCSITSNTGGANGNINHGSTANNAGYIQGSYCDISDLGDASTYAWYAEPGTLSGVDMDIDNFVFDGCGEVRFYRTAAFGELQNLDISNCTWKNGTGTYDLFLLISTLQPTTGSRSITNCVFNGMHEPNVGRYIDYTNCVFLGDVGNTQKVGSTIAGCLFRKTIATATALGITSVEDSYFVQEYTSNPHGWELADNADTTWDGNIIEPTGSANISGDFIMPGDASSACHHTIKNCILLPTPDGYGAGAFVSLVGNIANGNFSCDINHNTYFAGSGASFGVTVGESSSGYAGQITSLKSNIAWSTATGNNGYKLWRIAGTVQDIVAAANADYNCGDGLNTGEGGGYGALTSPPTLFSSGTPGTNDIDVDPQFVDDSRNLAAWDTSLGGAGTRANALSELAKLNDSDFDSNYTIANLIAYVRGGFAPTNNSLEDAGHDSVTVGAVEGVFSHTVTASDVTSGVPTLDTPTASSSGSVPLVTSTARVSVQTDGASNILDASGDVSVSSERSGGTITVGTSEESLTLSASMACPAYIENLDDTNYVDIGTATGVYTWQLKAGDVALIPLSPTVSTLYMVADTADVLIRFDVAGQVT